MAKKTIKTNIKELINTIITSMHDKKAEDVVLMDLTSVGGSSFDYFAICHAESSTQVRAIADNVEDKVRTECQLKPWHSEGFANSEWILLDFGEVLVHVFQTEVRAHYHLEDLWADAEIKHYHDEPVKITISSNERKTAKSNVEKPAKPAGKSTTKPKSTTTRTTKSATAKSEKSTTTKRKTTKE